MESFSNKEIIETIIVILISIAIYMTLKNIISKTFLKKAKKNQIKKP